MKISPVIIGFFLINLLFIISFPSESIGQEENGDNNTKIVKIEVKGNDDVSLDSIKNSIQTQFPSIRPWAARPKLDESIFEDDIEKIKALYADHGYYNAQITYEVNYRNENREAAIMIWIDQGKPVILRRLNVVVLGSGLEESNQDLELIEEINRKVLLKPNKVFSAIKLRVSKSKIRKILSSRGYPKFDLRPQILVNRKEEWAEANFEVVPGSKYKFGSIEIEGNQTVSDNLVRRELLYKTGDYYSLEKITDSQSDIFQLGYFKSVNIEQIYNDDKLEVDTIVRIKEKKLGSIRFGVGVASEDKLRTQVEWTQGNLLGGGRNMEILTKVSFITQLVQASISQPHITGRSSELIGFLSFKRDDLPSYEGSFITSSLALEKKLAKPLRGRSSFNVIYSDITSQSTVSPIERSRRNVFLTTFGGGLSFNVIDDLFNPTEGIASDTRLEVSLTDLGSDVDYLLSLTDLRIYKSVSKFVFAHRLELGFIYSFGSTDRFDIPIFKRFFAGGSNSFRGYNFQELGPLNSKGEPIGGNSLIVGNLEIRHPLPLRRLRGVVFLDYGNVYPGEFEYSLDGLRYAVGGGLRYDTIIGPVRFDIGYALNPDPELKRFHVFLSVGQAF